jgi:hypothetical protein
VLRRFTSCYARLHIQTTHYARAGASDTLAFNCHAQVHQPGLLFGCQRRRTNQFACMPSAALHCICHHLRASTVAYNVQSARQTLSISRTVRSYKMASAVLASACENVAPMDANPAPAKAPRIETFKVKRIHADAVLPKRGSDRAAGYDLSR